MINKIIEFSIKNKFIIGLFTFALIIWGLFSLKELPIDAVPDITNNQVQIITIAPTLATQEVEKFISTPIEIAVATIPNVVELRSISRLGLSVVTIVFKDDVDIYKARQLITERLSEAEEQIPQGVGKPELAPVSTGLSEIYQYVIRTKKGYESKYSAMDLRTIQDWIVKRQLLGTSGIAEVNSYGGFVKEYEVAINPDVLKSMNISVLEIYEALAKNNENTGGAYIDKKPNAYFIRGIGLVNSFDDIEKIVVKINPDGVPILIRDIAKVQVGNANRYGAFVVDTMGEGVGGVVMMLKGSNASQVIENVKERFKQIEKTLPEGVYIQPYLDRTDLVNRAIGTVSRNLIEGGLIVVFVLVLLLGNLRAGLVVASVIPLSMLFAVSMMNLFGVSGNLMSLGAIDFGLIVDGAVIVVESVVHRISKSKSHHVGVAVLARENMDSEVLASSKRMMNSATFGQIIILIVYLPILALVGIEGKMFRPMAQTVAFSILGALILSLTYVPVASTMFLSRKTNHKKDISDKIIESLQKFFDPAILFALKRKTTVIIISLILFVFSVFLFTRLGGEFIPNLEEGDLAAGVMTLQGGSLSNTVETVKKANAILMENFPEVKHAVCKIGAAEIPTDPTPVETGDYIIVMKPKSEWTSAKTREEMIEKMSEKLSVLAGVVFEFQQPIQMRFNELMTGSKQDVAVKIFGENLDSLAHEGERLESMIHGIEGVEDIQVEKVTGSAQIHISYNRDKIAQYGLNISDINKVVNIGFAGASTGVVYEEEKRFDLVLRLDKPYRQSLDNVKHLYIPLPSGNQIPLEEVADIEIKNGTAQVSRENTERRIIISFNVRNRDVESIVEDVQKIVDTKMKLPPGYYVKIGGQFENLIAAKKRLSIAVPIALLLIFIILFFTFNSLKQTLLIFSAVPFATIGGVFALYLRDMNFSISAGIGFIALFGVAVLNGIVLIAEFNRLEKEESVTDIYERVLKGLKIRLRPIIMTAAVASLGFMPMAVSVSAGAEVQKPLATVVIGGLISSTLLTLFVLPVLYIIYNRKRKRKKKYILSKLSIFICAFIAISYSQNLFSQNIKIYNIQQAVNQAINNNTDIKISDLQLKSQKVLKKSAWNFNKTKLDFTYGQTNSFEKDNEISISQEFEFPTVYINQNNLAKENVKKAEFQLNAKQITVVGEVKQIYYSLAYQLAKLKLFNIEDSIFSEFKNSAQLKFDKGEITILAKITAEAQISDIKNQINITKSDIEIYTKKLQNLLNESSAIRITDSLFLPKLQYSETNDTNIISKIPYYSINQSQVEISRLESSIEKSRILPEFSIGYFNQSNKEISTDKRFTGIQAGISLPLLFFSKSGNIQSAKINHEIALANFDYTKLLLNNELQNLKQEYFKQLKSLDYMEKIANLQADLIYKQADKEFKTGNIDYIEYLQFLKQFIEIKTQYLETLNAYNQSVINLESFIGKIN